MRLEGSLPNFEWLLCSMICLRKYPLEDEFETCFHLTAGCARGPIWEVMKKIQCLRFQKVQWPDDFAFADVWVMSVDGTHVLIEEPSHEMHSIDRKHFSHKFDTAWNQS